LRHAADIWRENSRERVSLLTEFYENLSEEGVGGVSAGWLGKCVAK
jgi:hypothetical protein